MWKFIIRRIAIMIPQLFILSILIFVLAKAMPGNALTAVLASHPNIAQSSIQDQEKMLGLNEPLPVQYWHWLAGIFHGNLGVSFIHQTSVIALIGDRLQNTLLLSFCILIVSYLIAIPLGIFSGRWENSLLDRAITGYTYVSYAMPIFVFAIFLLFIFSFWLNWFPTGGSVDPSVNPWTFAYAASLAQHLVLPTLAGAVLSTATTIQYLKSEIIETKMKDFVNTARSKGVPESRVYTRHILRNSFLPIAAFLGYDITGLIGGSVFLETIFSYPGLGQLFVQSIDQRDFAVVTALVMISGLAALLGTLLSDIILSLVDPRIRIE
ncbi:MAG: ABC transporter permease [Sporolactobacillus sp.]